MPTPAPHHPSLRGAAAPSRGRMHGSSVLVPIPMPHRSPELGTPRRSSRFLSLTAVPAQDTEHGSPAGRGSAPGAQVAGAGATQLCRGAGAVAWVRSWRSRLVLELKRLPHWAQPWGRVPVCTAWCRARWDLRLKPRPHCSQVKGRAPACALVWAIRLGRELKQRPHWGQAKGRSPVCTRRCRSRCWLWAKPRPQSGQAKGRSPVWVRWCVVRLGLWLKVFSQWGQA
uniref:Uncharacterized protein n=1 Tax=Anas platyrhynchos TaxID=8839 RepID=A0A8B9T5S3_ANAPL